ncbi:hypothetical protein C826_00006 [Helicobacter bilis WiWa]|uniref:Uncharacterized protein n=2 Tax=Helicobacter bilis TaxID=37372 RepID=N2BV09_9HELI|nr:hypothetical protein [Helicobacter bilis]EMZ42370.1 hypothetical protein C826_00006 [Helicobacter bilis WiWa]
MLAIIFFIIIPLVLFFYFKYNIGSIIVILSLLFIFYYTPYSFYLEPSFWQFRRICKLNELPNNEEKYNKILSYFDTDLDILDWEELNGRKWKVTKEHGFYRQGIYEYATTNKGKQLNSRTSIIAAFLSNESKINHYNINQMSIGATWHTKRYYPAGNEGSGFRWSEETLGCVDVAKKNYEPKGANNEK